MALPLATLVSLAPVFKESIGNTITTLASGISDAFRTGATAKGKALENFSAGGRDIMSAVADRIRHGGPGGHQP